jgi:tetratricopeptide (TPR) repeat protein
MLLLAALASVVGGQFVLSGPGDHPARARGRGLVSSASARATAALSGPAASTSGAASGDSAGTGGVAGTDAMAGAPATEATEASITRLEALLRGTPDQPELLTKLGVAYLARAAETADPAWYPRASEVLLRSNALDGGQPATLTALGQLAVARNDFLGALDWGSRALALQPAGAGPLGVVFDAQVGLGAYDQAAATAQTMVTRAPGPGSLERLGRIRFLQGDSAGALTALQQAASTATGPAAAAPQALVGDLHLGRGELAEATDAYRTALRLAPGYQPAEVGLGRIAIVGGDLDTAVKLLATAAASQPLPATVALLGDVRELLGQRPAAARQYQLVRSIAARERAAGVDPDLELARFEADRASERDAEPEDVVELAERALRQRPGIEAEDTLALALRADDELDEALGHAKAAVRLGTRDAVLWYHLAAIEADLGQAAAARRDLAAAVGIDPFLMGTSATIADRAGARSVAAKLGMRLPGLEAGDTPG